MAPFPHIPHSYRYFVYTSYISQNFKLPSLSFKDFPVRLSMATASYGKSLVKLLVT